MISERFYQNGLVRSIHVDVEYAVSCCSTEALVRVCRDLRFVVLAQVARSGAVLLPLGQGVERVRAEAVLDPCGTAVNTAGLLRGSRSGHTHLAYFAFASTAYRQVKEELATKWNFLF